jgi:FKBP-type peptidyl-prolyl cis-trans isomerase
MIRKFIPGALALGLIAATYAEPPAEGETAQVAPEEGAAVVAPEAAPDDLASITTNASYALGYQSAMQLRQFGLKPEDVSNEAYLSGFLASLKGEDPELPPEQLQAAMEALGNILQEREQQAGVANLEAGREFLEENAKRDGVTTTASGLQYEIVEKGGDETYSAPAEGEPANKQFLVNYRGTLIDGTEFDASQPGQPVPMTLEVIEGFKEALTMMPVGAKWKLFIPSELAYGPERRGPDIAPNSVLIFELELVKIQDAPPAPQGGFPFPLPE